MAKNKLHTHTYDENGRAHHRQRARFHGRGRRHRNVQQQG